MRIFSILLLLLLLPVRALADERWHILTIADVPVGWVSEERDDGRTRTAMSARRQREARAISQEGFAGTRSSPFRKWLLTAASGGGRAAIFFLLKCRNQLAPFDLLVESPDGLPTVRIR